MHTSHDALWRPLGALGPSFILSPLKLGGPTRLRPSLFLALSSFFACYFSPLASRSPSPSRPPSRPPPFPPAPLSLSLLLFSLCYSTIGFSPRLSCCRRIIPHIIEHRAQERKTPRLSLRAVPLVPIRPVPVCGFQLKRRSYEGLRETLRRLFLE